MFTENSVNVRKALHIIYTEETCMNYHCAAMKFLLKWSCAFLCEINTLNIDIALKVLSALVPEIQMGNVKSLLFYYYSNYSVAFFVLVNPASKYVHNGTEIKI